MANPLASLIHGTGTALKTYGAIKSQSAEDEKRKADAAEREKAKRIQGYHDQYSLFSSLGDPQSQYVASYLKKYADANPDNLRSFSDKELEMIARGHDGEQVEFDQILKKITGRPDVDWGPLAQQEGIAPGMLGTNEGKAKAASSLVDYSQFLGKPDMAMQSPAAQGPTSVNMDLVKMVEEHRKNKALLVARNKKEVNDIVNPPKPELSPVQKGHEAATTEITKKRDLEAAGYGDDTNKPAKPPITTKQKSGYLDKVVATRKQQFLQDHGYKDEKELASAARSIANKVKSLVTDDARDILAEYRKIDTEYRSAIDNPESMNEFYPDVDWAAVYQGTDWDEWGRQEFPGEWQRAPKAKREAAIAKRKAELGIQ